MWYDDPCGLARCCLWGPLLGGKVSPELRDRPGGHHSRGQWASNFAGEQVESILRGGVCASSEMVGHVALSQEFFAPFVDAPPGVVRMGD